MGQLAPLPRSFDLGPPAPLGLRQERHEQAGLHGQHQARRHDVASVLLQYGRLPEAESRSGGKAPSRTSQSAVAVASRRSEPERLEV